MMARWLIIALFLFCIPAEAGRNGYSLPPNFIYGPLDVAPAGATAVYTSGQYGVTTNYVITTGHSAGAISNIDYTQRVYYTPGNLTSSNVVISQQWPAYSGQELRGFPEIRYDATARIKINLLSNFSVDYQTDISGSLNDFAVALDTWLYQDSSSTTPLFELYIGLYVPASWGSSSNQPFNFDTISPCSGSTVFYDAAHGPPPLVSVQCVSGSSHSALTGPINIKAALNLLIANGIITGNEYIGTMELGTELRQFNARVTVSRFVVTFN